MEIENIVANTVYIKARESGGSKSKGKSRKWKTYLQFPHISECIHIKSEIDVTYSYVVDKQPIGKELFRQFCLTCPQYASCSDFLYAVQEYETGEPDERRRLAAEISLPSPPEVLNEAQIQRCLAAVETARQAEEPKKEIYAECCKSVEKEQGNCGYKIV